MEIGIGQKKYIVLKYVEKTFQAVFEFCFTRFPFPIKLLMCSYQNSKGLGALDFVMANVCGQEHAVGKCSILTLF